ncbi:MAG: LysM peptidoglycan-binding domain-containing protein [Bacteroidota bacterium]
MKKLFFLQVAAVLWLFCADTIPQKSPTRVSSIIDLQSHRLPVQLASLSFFSADTIPVRPNQSVDETDSTAADSSGEMNEKQIAELLERAREHYLIALQAQAEGDSIMSADEFEEAIKHLNEASYFPNIEDNLDFNELTRSVIEDYEKYIATIDSLGENSSIFALREKLNLDIEKIDITNINIPASLIPKTEVPLHVNEYTKRTLAFFMGKGRVHMENWIRRSGRYFPIMSRIFAEEGLPQELMLLSLPESGLNPTARSWAKAVGLWQFMKATGGQYGLRSNYWYDERRDFEKATRAAARHMKDLYREFNDWHLVFVAYNAGGGWVRRGIRRSGSTDYWEMRAKLPRETRNYVPQYIATALIILRPEAFGFGDVEKEDSLAFEVSTVDDCVDLSILAECAETDLETIKSLNPELTQWCTPPNYKGYKLRVPVGKSAIFAENYAKIPEEKKFDFATHTIRRGETVSQIANRYKITKAVLLEVNKLSKSKRLKVGATLVIPIRSNSASAIVEAQRLKEKQDIERANKLKEEGRKLAASSSSSSTPVTAQSPARPKRKIVVEKPYEPAGREKITYVVKTGETLGHIAEWFNVRASHIRNWNNIPYGRHIYKGQKLAIWVPEEKLKQYEAIAKGTPVEKQKGITSSSKKRTKNERSGTATIGWVNHKVKKGETLEKIAEDYDVAIADLKTWNRLKTSRINAGETLEVYSPDQSEEPADEPVVKKKSSVKSAKVRSVTYVVKKGDTLEKVAEKYGMTVQELKKSNDLRSTKISAGQKLIIQK